MNADGRRWMSMIAVVIAFALGCSIGRAAEVKFVCEDFLQDEVGQIEEPEPVAFQAEEFPWGFELTKEVLLQEETWFRSRSGFEFRIKTTESQSLKGLDPCQFEWGFAMTSNIHPYVTYNGKPMTFGGMGFNR